MTRSITRTLPLLATLFVFVMLSSQSHAQLVGGKHHYGRSMYVKANRQKHDAERRSSIALSSEASRTTDDLAMLPQRGAQRLGDNDVQPHASKLSVAIANVLHPTHKASRTTSAVASAANQRPATDPLMIQTVNYTPEAAAAPPSDDGALLHILVIIGVILIIAAIISLILSVAPAGWVSLLVLGLLIILIAYIAL